MLKDTDLISARSNLEVSVQRNMNTGNIEIAFFVESPGEKSIGHVDENGYYTFTPFPGQGSIIPDRCMLKMTTRMASLLARELTALLKLSLSDSDSRSAVHTIVDKIVDSGVGSFKMETDSNGVKIETYIGEKTK